MNEKKKEKIVSLVALIIAFIALTICYLAYSNTIKIENELKNKNADLDYNIAFSTNKDEIIGGDIKPTVSISSSNKVSASTAKLDGTTISNIYVNFYEKNTYAEYNFFVFNDSNKDLYLKDIIFLDIVNLGSNKKCTPLIKATEEEIKTICDSVKIGIINKSYSNEVIYESIYDIEGVKIDNRTYQTIDLIISYDENSIERAIPFEIEFGDIYFKYDLNK